jgi:hypothetical protein
MTHLLTVSFAFYQAYQQRQTADYDTAKQWTRTEALAIIDSVDAAFKAWPRIRNHNSRRAIYSPFSAIRREDKAASGGLPGGCYVPGSPINSATLRRSVWLNSLRASSFMPAVEIGSPIRTVTACGRT